MTFKYIYTPMITGPFYHKLHIVQLEIMYGVTGENIFYEYII